MLITLEKSSTLLSMRLKIARRQLNKCKRDLFKQGIIDVRNKRMLSDNRQYALQLHENNSVTLIVFSTQFETCV